MSDTGFNRQYIGRRKFLQILAVAGAAGALYGYGVLRAEKPAQIVRQSRSLMGTQINLIVYGPDEDQCLGAIHDTFSRMEMLEGVFSRYLPESAVSQLNAQGHLEVAPEDLMQVLNLAEKISQATEGAFDVTVLPLLRLYDHGLLPSAGKIAEILPLVDYQRIKREGQGVYFSRKGMGVTFDGIAKGYIVDQGVDALQKAGFANVYVEAGGDLMVSGTKPAHLPWRIGVQNPRAESTQAMTVLELGKPLAVATSGDYMQPFSKDLRNHHILDPRKGLSPPELASATVTAPSVALADGLATAAMVLGHTQAIALLQQFDDCEGLFIDKQLKTFKTSGFQG